MTRILLAVPMISNELSPRGQRSRMILGELERRGIEVDLLGAQESRRLVAVGAPEAKGKTQRKARRVVGKLRDTVLIDGYELQSRLDLWKYDGYEGLGGAILIGYPWSMVGLAAKRLAREGVPYVVDVGDPWCLTGDSRERLIVSGRSRRLEKQMWSHSSGGIFTTNLQAESVAKLFGGLGTFVRPNGYLVPDPAKPPTKEVEQTQVGQQNGLRLVHYGSLGSFRVPISPTLKGLSDGTWNSVSMTQLGGVYSDHLDDLHMPHSLYVDVKSSVPWPEVLSGAWQFDAAIVLGNVNPAQLPSKAIQYLTLPIPVIAITSGEPNDALAEFAKDRPKWLLLTAGEGGAAERVSEFLERVEKLPLQAPPEKDSWPEVAREVVSFALTSLERAT